MNFRFRSGWEEEGGVVEVYRQLECSGRCDAAPPPIGFHSLNFIQLN